MQPKFEIPQCATCEPRLRSIFSDLGSSSLESLSAHKGCNFHKAGQILFQEGGYPAGLYCINKGKLKIYKLGDDGKEHIVRLAKEGDVAGYRSLISGEPYTASAEVIEESAICFIPKVSFFNLLRESSSFNARMMALLCHDLATAENRELSLAQRSVRERLAETLLMLKEFYGLESDGVTLKGMVSRSDLANMIGTSPETVIRFLSEWKDKGIIGLDQKKLSLLNSGALLRITHVFD